MITKLNKLESVFYDTEYRFEICWFFLSYNYFHLDLMLIVYSRRSRSYSVQHHIFLLPPVLIIQAHLRSVLLNCSNLQLLYVFVITPYKKIKSAIALRILQSVEKITGQNRLSSYKTSLKCLSVAKSMIAAIQPNSAL